MNDKPTHTPMTAAEFFIVEVNKRNVELNRKIVLDDKIVIELMDAYHQYRLAFDREQQPPADPYYTDPATWPEWAKWRAVDEDGCVYFSSQPMELNLSFGSWSTSIYAASKMVPRAVTHNPDWRNSLRSREEVSGGK